MSAILFVILMNVLSLMLNKAASEGVFCYHYGCDQMQLTHLCFADDFLIFLHGNEDSLKGVLSVLADFELISGLSVNLSKTTMFCSGIDESNRERPSNVYRLKQAELPVRYPGLPLSSMKLSVRDFDPLFTQIKKKLGSWTTRALSMAGCLTLISSVIYGINGFWASAFFIPKQVMKRINALRRSFLWHGSIGISTSAKVSLMDISYPKKEGSLGLRNFESWNETCAIKLIWMLLFIAGSIWAAWVRNKYLSTSPFWALNECNYAYSWMFRRILKIRTRALKFLRIHIRKGD